MSDTMLSQSDHDAIIRISATMESHNRQEDEVRRAMLSQLSILAQKVDDLIRSFPEQTRDIRDLKAEWRDQDIRIATLESQVDSLRDGIEERKIVTKTMAESIEARQKRWRWTLLIVVPILSLVVPTIFKWLVTLIAGGF